MTASVVEVVSVNAISSPTTTVTITQTINAGDVIVVLAGSLNNDTNITAASGCGGTWAALGNSGATSQGAVVGWIGTGVTTAGNISLTFSAARPGVVRAFLIRGLNGTNASWIAPVATSSTSLAGPMHPVGAGQIILGIGTNVGGTQTLSQTSGSWTQQTVFTSTGSVNTQYLAPTSIAYYGQTVASSSSTTVRLAQVVVGTPTDTQAAVTVFESLSVATGTITVTSPVNTGDQLVVTLAGTANDSDITAISGCGATWSSLGHSGASISGTVAGWVGANPTSQGPISITVSSARAGTLRVFLIHGGNGSTTTWNATSGNATTVNGPSDTAGLGQTVIALTEMNGSGSTALTAVSGTWTTQTQRPASTGVATNSAYAVPTSSGTYQQSAVQGGASNARVAQIVIGSVSSTKHGSGTGAFDWAGSGTGHRAARGSGSGAFTWAGSATGHKVQHGAGAGAFNWASSSTGHQVSQGAGAGAFDWAGSASGTTPSDGLSGSGAGAFEWVGSATGHLAPHGSGSGAFDWSGSSTGHEAPHGTGAGAFTWAGSAAGTEDPSGSGSGAFAWVGAASGSNVTGNAGAFGWVGVAVGRNGVTAATSTARILTVAAEDRTVLVPFEARTLTVPQEA